MAHHRSGFKRPKHRAHHMQDTLNYVGSHLTYSEGLNSVANSSKHSSGRSHQVQVQSSLINAFLNRKRPSQDEQKSSNVSIPSVQNIASSVKKPRKGGSSSIINRRTDVETQANDFSPKESCYHGDHASSRVDRQPINTSQEADGAYRAQKLFNTNHGSHETGANAFLKLSGTGDNGARLTLENYREQIKDLIRRIRRNDLLPTLERGHGTSQVNIDPVESFYLSPSSQHHGKHREGPVLRSQTRQAQTLNSLHPSQTEADPRTCDVKMRVRIQYKSHSHVLSSVDSVKNSQEERQFDKYFQATSIMRSRDTGCVVCDISFTDITYLGAFWRDYTNGTLQEALRAVFLTEMMRQTAGDEELDLFVSIDENDFLKGQWILIENLTDKNRKKSHTLPVRSLANTARIER